MRPSLGSWGEGGGGAADATEHVARPAEWRGNTASAVPAVDRRPIPYADLMTPPQTAITGGTGFVGRHLVERLGTEASVVISRRTGAESRDVDALTRAFEGSEVVAHSAGINREIGDQTYQRVRTEGTANVIEAAKWAGVPR